MLPGCWSGECNGNGRGLGSPVLAIATGVPIVATRTATELRPVRAPALLADAITLVVDKSLGIARSVVAVLAVRAVKRSCTPCPGRRQRRLRARRPATKTATNGAELCT